MAETLMSVCLPLRLLFILGLCCRPAAREGCVGARVLALRVRVPTQADVWVRWALLGLEKRRLNSWRLQEEQPLLRTVCTRVGTGDLDVWAVIVKCGF